MRKLFRKIPADNFRITREMLVSFALGAALCAGIMGFLMLVTGGATAAEYSTNGTESFTLPTWVYPTILAGIVQGLVVFGAVNVKFDWLFQRMTALEKKQADDHKEVNVRIDRILENRRRTDHE